MELCSCTSSCCSSGEDSETDRKCESSSEENETSKKICVCTCKTLRNDSKTNETKTIVSVKKIKSKEKYRRKNENCEEENEKCERELELAKKLLCEFLKSNNNKKAVKKATDNCESKPANYINLVVKGTKSDSDVHKPRSDKKYKNKHRNQSFAVCDYNCRCDCCHVTCEEYKTKNNEKLKFTKEKKKFNDTCCSSDNKGESSQRRNRKKEKVFYDTPSTDESDCEEFKNWCKNNKNITFKLCHDRNLNFKESPCPTLEVNVTEMKKFKNNLKSLDLNCNNFDIIPGIGPIYNRRLQKRFKNFYELFETACMMEKEDFKGLMKCYANINAYYSEMIYKTSLHYVRNKKLHFC